MKTHQTLVHAVLLSLMPALLSLMLFGCPKSTNRTPPATSTSALPPVADVNVAACANLARLGCPEGTSPACVSVFQKTAADKITDLKASCLATAESVDAARACGTVVCTTP